jgi:photosystem II stability/assembly factor-like uncharacterized protein
MDHVWAVGAGGLVLRSDDAGRRWEGQIVPLGSQGEETAAPDDSPIQQQAVPDAAPKTGARLRPALDGVAPARLDRSPRDADWSFAGMELPEEKKPPDPMTQYAPDAGNQVDDANSPRPEVSRPYLNAVHFIDERHGWAAGDAGVVIATADGGKTWRRQASGVTADLEAVHFADRNTGWAGGWGSTLLATADGGRTWQRQRTRARHVYAVQALSATVAWAAGSSGVVLRTGDGGRTWQDLRTGFQGDVTSIQFLDEQKGWVASGSGIVLSTTDGGRTWVRHGLEPAQDLFDLHFATPSIGWAVGEAGRIFATRDAGRTWEVRDGRTRQYLDAVSFSDSRHGWVAGDAGALLATSDGGRTWRSATRMVFRWARFDDDAQGWAVTEGREAFSSSDGGRSWTRSATVPPEPYGTGSRASLPWRVEDDGGLSRTADRFNWQRQETGIRTRLRAVDFADPNTGWVVGDSATILTTRDGGATWRRQAAGIDEDLVAVRFFSARRGLAVGSGGTVIRTSDGGATWTHENPTRSPAPWYYLGLAAVGGLLAPALRRPGVVVKEKRSVADVLVSDKPLEVGDPDPLDLSAVALGLSRFLRNRNTTPPLTIAVTGRWGSGKSSLMNLLRADLQAVGFPTVWFNAWHNQKEAHLLASLLQSVRLQAVPPIWKPGGVAFRMRLLARRSWRRWPLALALLALFSLSLGYFQSHPERWAETLDAIRDFGGRILRQPGAAIQKLLEAPGDVAGGIYGLLEYLAGQTGQPAPPNKSVFGVLLGSGGAILLSAFKWLRAFGVRSAAARSSAKDAGGALESALQTGSRHAFATEFRDVTEALKPRKLLVLVDDLDRCQPKNVAEVLEAINFLISAGDCFVVLGMERDLVKRCVGLAYEEIAKDLVGEGWEAEDQAPGAAPKKVPLGIFAEQYLEKLINIEVPVPEPAAEESRRLVESPSEEYDAVRRRLRRAAAFSREAAPWALAGSLLLGCYLAGYMAFAPAPSTGAPPPSAGGAAAPRPGAEGAGAARPDGGAAGRSRPEGRAPDGVAFIPGETPRRRVSLVFMTLAGIGLVVAGAVRLSLGPETILKDSPEFEEALRAWHPLVAARRNTPRSIKRFVNKVRYFAMAQRPHEARHSPLELLEARLDRLRGRAPARSGAGAAAQDGVPEDVIVGFAALQYAYGTEFGDRGDHHDWLRAVQAAIAADDRLPGTEKRRIAALIDRLTSDLRERRPAFDALTRGVRFAGEAALQREARARFDASGAAPA